MMRRFISHDEMESRRRQSLLVSELTEAIGRAHQKNSEITCIEVIAALLSTMDRWLKLEMSPDK